MSEQSAEESLYGIPEFAINPNGWGPCSVPDRYKDLPLELFSRDDKMGMIVDITPAFNYQRQHYGDAADNDFVVVDSARVATPRKSKLLHTKTKTNYNANSTVQNASTSGKRVQKKGTSQFTRRNYDSLHVPSVIVQSSWTNIAKVDFSDLQKLSVKVIPTATDLAECGSYNTYDSSFDSIDIKKPRALVNHPECGDLKYVSVMKDPFITKVAESNAAQVYTTDVALAQLMVAMRSQLSWDLEVIKNDQGLFISHRDGMFDQYTVNETSTDLPTEEENKDNCLRKEVTDINRDFAKQIMTSEVTKCEFPSPFGDDNPDKINRMYRYRKFALNSEQTLLVRTEVHGKLKDSDALFNAYAMNEWCARTPLTNRWRARLDSSPGYALADDMKNNNYRLSKWGVQAILSGVNSVKIGYVSRRTMDNVKNGHYILCVQSFSVDSFKKQIMLNENNMWAVLDFFVRELNKQENGHYILLKDPVKSFIRIYKVPDDEVPTMPSPPENPSNENSEYSEYSDYSDYTYSDED